MRLTTVRACGHSLGGVKQVDFPDIGMYIL